MDQLNFAKGPNRECSLWHARHAVGTAYERYATFPQGRKADAEEWLKECSINMEEHKQRVDYAAGRGRFR